MTARLLDGRLVSDSLLTQVEHAVKRLNKRNIRPKLIIIIVGENPASLSYIRQKEKAAARTGIVSETMRLPLTTTTKKLVAMIERLNADHSVHGILVQLPLPTQIDAPLVMRAIDPHKDVDGFGAYNLGKMLLSKEFEYLAPCTPRGIITMLEYYNISPSGKHVVVVGRSNIVGKPVAMMLVNRDATVTLCHSKTKNLAFYTKQADMLIAAVGQPRMITADMVKKDVVVIDVGVTRVENALVGDVDFDRVKRKASFLTPVPGGVGPMTVACLMENVVRAAQKLSKPQ